MDKEDMVYIHNRILLSHKEEWNNDICSTMDGFGGHYVSEISQIKTNTLWYHLYMESKKYNKLVTTTKKKTTYR